ncbi:PAQR family membrane homeostasis protein TrhA [Kordiimonas aestuarii]|uniref:PAQR family membrane homeostasis protein TrhA n=1 Tax=Kordiimonas aestuarii TaxID=1005925 RepID=UPI0021D0881C|nr:hemolysin III family protein [Kordiimonas aestuarii]
MSVAKPIRDYSPSEEAWHAITHGVAAVLAVVGLVFLIMKAAEIGGVSVMVAATLYGGFMVAMYVCSTLYHSFFRSRFTPLLKTLDHSSIYFKIAGAYTPFALLALPTTVGVWVLACAWSAAVLGAALKFRGYVKKTGKKFSPVSLLLYLGMGWAGVLMIGELMDRLPSAAIWWLVAGGLCYTIGALFYALKRLPYTHAVWHVFVMAGSACHFITIYFYVMQPGGGVS